MHETAHVNTRARCFTSALRVPESDRRSRSRFGSRSCGHAELWQVTAPGRGTVATVGDGQVSQAGRGSRGCGAPRSCPSPVHGCQSASRMTSGYLNWDSLQVPESWVVAWDNPSRYTEKDSPAGLGGTGERGRFVFSSSGDSIRVAGTNVVPRDGSLVSPLASCVGAAAKNLSAAISLLRSSSLRHLGITTITLSPAGRARLSGIRRLLAGHGRPVRPRSVWQ